MVTQIRERYQRWEDRARGRFSAWSTRRRWVTFVLVPTLVVCCGGGVFGVPIAWVLRSTVEAGKGAPTPDAAADSYLMALSYNQEDGLLPLLDDEHQDELLKQWHAYRAEMEGTDPPPSRLDFGALTVGPIVDGRAEVTTDVSASWWGTNGRAIAYNSQEYRWTIETREDDGWRVSAVKAPAWCGGYVLASKCRTR